MYIMFDIIDAAFEWKSTDRLLISSGIFQGKRKYSARDRKCTYCVLTVQGNIIRINVSKRKLSCWLSTFTVTFFAKKTKQTWHTTKMTFNQLHISPLVICGIQILILRFQFPVHLIIGGLPELVNVGSVHGRSWKFDVRASAKGLHIFETFFAEKEGNNGTWLPSRSLFNVQTRPSEMAACWPNLTQRAL